MKRGCAIYARTAAGGPSAVDAQIRTARTAALAPGSCWRSSSLRECRDVNASGVGQPGPGLAALLDDVASGAVELVIVTDPTRLSRSTERLHEILAALRRAGTRLVIAEQER